MAGCGRNDLENDRVKRMHEELQDNGVVVVPDVISPEQCDEYVADIRAWLRQFETSFPSNIHSIIHRYGIAHHASAWKTRLHAKSVFEDLWGTPKLHTSMDGIAIGRPPETSSTDFDHRSPGEQQLHLEQGPRKKGLHAYQGAVYLEEATVNDWCFLAMEKSHNFHEQYFKTFGKKSRSDFCKLSEQEQKWYKERGCEVKRIAVPKGGIVLWDSRLVHAGAPPIQGREHSGRWRFVVFVSMTPAIWSNRPDNDERKHGYRTLRCSRHWSSQGFSLFDKVKPTPFDIQELPEIAKTKPARLLAGDLEYKFSGGKSNGPKWKPLHI